MDLQCLAIELSDLILPDEAYSSERTWNRLAALVRVDNWNEVSRIASETIAAALKALSDKEGKDKCLDLLRTLAAEEANRATEAIAQSIRKTTSFHIRGSLGDTLVQLHERAEEQELRSNLLAVAFADRLTDLVFPAADRAAKLASLIVRQQPSPVSEKYLEEACFCYFYELYSACAVMCRSVLEEIVRKQIRTGQPGEIMEVGNTLGALVSKAKTLKAIPAEAFHEIDRVKELGDRAAHGDPLREENAWECLLAARHAVSCILRARN